jgi:hypothetical protein
MPPQSTPEMDHEIKPEIIHAEDVDYDEDTNPQTRPVVQI